MKKHTFVDSTLEVKASASLEAEVIKDLINDKINDKSIAQLLEDEEKNNTQKENDQNTQA